MGWKDQFIWVKYVGAVKLTSLMACVKFLRKDEALSGKIEIFIVSHAYWASLLVIGDLAWVTRPEFSPHFGVFFHSRENFVIEKVNLNVS